MPAETSTGKDSGGSLPIMAAVSNLASAPATPASSRHAGQSAGAVVDRGSGAVAEAGRVAGLSGAMRRVRWEACSSETRAPVNDLSAFREQAHGVDTRQATGSIFTAEAPGLAGRMSLPHLLLNRPVGR